MSKKHENTDWLSLILGGLLYMAFVQWFFSKSYRFRIVTFFILLAISWIWVLCGAPGK